MIHLKDSNLHPLFFIVFFYFFSFWILNYFGNTVKPREKNKPKNHYGRSNLHLSWFVVPSIMVLVGRAVTVTQEAFEAIFTTQLTNNLVQCLTVEGVVIHCKGGIANGWKQGCICVLPSRRNSASIKSDARITLQMHLQT